MWFQLMSFTSDSTKWRHKNWWPPHGTTWSHRISLNLSVIQSSSSRPTVLAVCGGCRPLQIVHLCGSPTLALITACSLTRSAPPVLYWIGQKLLSEEVCGQSTSSGTAAGLAATSTPPRWDWIDRSTSLVIDGWPQGFGAVGFKNLYCRFV